MQVEAVALDRERRPQGADVSRVARAAAGFILARRKRRKRPAVHGDRRAPVEGCGLGRLVRALFERSVIEQAATPEPDASAITNAAHDGLEVDERRWQRGVKDNAAVGIANEDAIEHHDMHVHIQVQAPAEALHEGDRTTLAAREPIPTRARSVETEDRFDEEARHRAEHLRLEGRERTQLDEDRAAADRRWVEIDGVFPSRKGKKGFEGKRRSYVDSHPTHLLSGSLKCGTCGGAIALVSGKGSGYYGCLNASRRSCENKVLIARKRLEDKFVAAINDEVLKPDVLAAMNERAAKNIEMISRARSAYREGAANIRKAIERGMLKTIVASSFTPRGRKPGLRGCKCA